MLKIIGRRPGALQSGYRAIGQRPPYYDFAVPEYNRPGAGYAYEAALAQKRAHNEALVREAPPTESDDLVIGLESLAVPAATAATATQRPQVVFRPTRILIPAAIAPSFTVDDIKVGNKSQLVANGSLPGETFDQTSFGWSMAMATCDVSQDLILEVTNTSGGALDFRASIFGKAVW